MHDDGAPVRIYLCRCGCVHVETRHTRRTFRLDELIERLARRRPPSESLDDVDTARLKLEMSGPT